jgi:acylphosphatase
LRIESRGAPSVTSEVMADVHHEIVIFSGRVQGVGFRFSTLEVAKEFDVAGYVTNLADGRVQLEVEGRPDVVNAFITAVEQRMHGYVRKTERTSDNRPPQFKGFTIK